MKSLQNPEIRKSVLANLDSREREDLRISLFPDGSLILEPGCWPDEKCTRGLDGPISLTPQQALALRRFFDGQRVKDRMLDIWRRRMLRHGPPELRTLVRWIDRQFDQGPRDASHHHCRSAGRRRRLSDRLSEGLTAGAKERARYGAYRGVQKYRQSRAPAAQEAQPC